MLVLSNAHITHPFIRPTIAYRLVANNHFFFLDIEISTAIKQHEQRHRHFVVDLLPRHDEFLFTMSNHLSIYYRLSINCLWPIPLFQQHVILDLCFILL